MSKDVYKFRIGQRDLTVIKFMKDNEIVVDLICKFVPKSHPTISSIIAGAQATYKGVIVAADIYEAKTCLLFNK